MELVGQDFLKWVVEAQASGHKIKWNKNCWMVLIHIWSVFVKSEIFSTRSLKKKKNQRWKIGKEENWPQAQIEK